MYVRRRLFRKILLCDWCCGTILEKPYREEDGEHFCSVTCYASSRPPFNNLTQDDGFLSSLRYEILLNLSRYAFLITTAGVGAIVRARNASPSNQIFPMNRNDGVTTSMQDQSTLSDQLQRFHFEYGETCRQLGFDVEALERHLGSREGVAQPNRINADALRTLLAEWVRRISSVRLQKH